MTEQMPTIGRPVRLVWSLARVVLRAAAGAVGPGAEDSDQCRATLNKACAALEEQNRSLGPAEVLEP